MERLNRAAFLQLGLAVQVVVLTAACSYDRRLGHPLRDRRTQLAHLLRRAGFGAHQEQLDEYGRLGLIPSIDRLLDYEQIPDESEERIRAFGLDLGKLADLQRWWLLRLVYTKRPLQEKMVLFWHGLLTSGTGKVGLPNPRPNDPNPPHHMLNQHEFFRQHALGRFDTILSGIARDPAMMIWLDAQTNNRTRPNENFARELMELFTLGEGHYTEQDVREAARAFTGTRLENGRFLFREANHDAGWKTVLGKSGRLRGDDVVKHLIEQPQTARYLSRRLFEYFAYPNPSEQDLQPLFSAYMRTGGSIKDMLRALFVSPAFYSPRAYRALVKSPVEFVVGAVRATGATTSGGNLPGYTSRMGQALFNPPNVAGWPGGTRWLNSTTWLERVNFGNHLLTARNDSNTTPPPMKTILERNNLHTPEAIYDYFAGLLLDGHTTRSMRDTLLTYLTSGRGDASPPLPIRPTATNKPAPLPAIPLRTGFVEQKVRGMVYLMLASPEYQLA
jgi:hypothetical protein